MTSEIKIQANRQNAQKSTGPRTPEGRANASQNSVTHGLRSRRAVLLVENQREFDRLSATHLAEWQPATPTETDLVEQLVILKWKLARYEGVESQACMQSALVLIAFKDPMNFQTGKGTILFPNVVDGTEAQVERALTRFSQQLASLERSYFRTLETLQRQQDRRLKQGLRQSPPAPALAVLPTKPKVFAAGASPAAFASAEPKPAASVPRPEPARRRAAAGA